MYSFLALPDASIRSSLFLWCAPVYGFTGGADFQGRGRTRKPYRLAPLAFVQLDHLHLISFTRTQAKVVAREQPEGLRSGRVQ